MGGRVTHVTVALSGRGAYAGAMTPTMPPTRCTQPGCTRLTPSGASRCPAHANRTPSAHTRWLQAHPSDRAPWASLRTRTLQAHPSCQWQGCTAPSTEVDHIVEIADGGAFLDEGNVQALCHEHHERKTAIAAANRKANSTRLRKAKGKAVKRRPRIPRDATWVE